MAKELISMSCELPVGYSTATTLMIFPLRTVSCTCTGPNWVFAAVPVTVVDVARTDDRFARGASEVFAGPDVSKLPALGVPLAAGGVPAGVMVVEGRMITTP